MDGYLGMLQSSKGKPQNQGQSKLRECRPWLRETEACVISFVRGVRYSVGQNLPEHSNLVREPSKGGE